MAVFSTIGGLYKDFKIDSLMSLKKIWLSFVFLNCYFLKLLMAKMIPCFRNKYT